MPSTVDGTPPPDSAAVEAALRKIRGESANDRDGGRRRRDGGRRAPGPISAWEIGGIPAAGLFYAANHLGWLSLIEISEEQVPDFMLICFCGAALVRALGPRVPGWIRRTVSFIRSLRKA